MTAFVPALQLMVRLLPAVVLSRMVFRMGYEQHPARNLMLVVASLIVLIGYYISTIAPMRDYLMKNQEKGSTLFLLGSYLWAAVGVSLLLMTLQLAFGETFFFAISDGIYSDLRRSIESSIIGTILLLFVRIPNDDEGDNK